VSEERQRILREQGSAPGETQKQEAAQASKEQLGEEQAEEAAEATSAREGEEQDKPKRGRRRKRADAEPKADQEDAPAPAEADAPAEAEKKPRRRRAKAEAGPEEAKREADAEEAEAEAAEAAPDEEPADEDESARPKGGRRRGSEVAAARERKPAPRRDREGNVMVRARARYVRTAPRKARLVIDHIRGRSVDDARAILIHTPRAASRDVLKLLESAVANAENNHELVADELKVGRVFVDEGPIIKRYRPRALGRATRINKRTSHMTIELVEKEQA
jgi:ribosomal protein L22